MNIINIKKKLDAKKSNLSALKTLLCSLDTTIERVAIYQNEETNKYITQLSNMQKDIEQKIEALSKNMPIEKNPMFK